MTSTRTGIRGSLLRRRLAIGTATAAALAAWACSSDNNPSGGSPEAGTTGGQGGSGTGGSTSSGGSTSGGSTSTGGSTHTGGSAGTGTGGSSGGAGGGTAGSTGQPDGGPDAASPDGGGLVSLDVTETDLVANTAGVAPTTDPNLLNPWGLVANPTAGPFWVSDNHSGMATVYEPTGGAAVLSVKIPGPADTDGGFTSAPSGQVYNGTTADFMGDKFIIDSEDGTLEGWQTAGQPFVLRVDNSADSGYKGLAIITSGAKQELVAANFHKGSVDVFDASYVPITNPGFVDMGTPALPDGFAAFNVAALGDSVYISYAKQDAEKGDDVAGPGNGYVSVFKTDGTFEKRLVSGGDLNSPWGMAIAPASWGALAGTLLVGNFGDGSVHAYDADTGTEMGMLTKSGTPLVIQGLWALVPGPKVTAGDYSSSLYFTAGPHGEDDGLLGKLDVAK